MDRYPKKYVPVGLTVGDSLLQKECLRRSRKAYKKGVYIDRPLLKSAHSKRSSHVFRAKHIYGVESMKPTTELSRATGCSKKALKQIIKKGEGAYYSSGSRPNQTAQSWAYARLASALTGGPSSQVDYTILKSGCSKKSHPIVMANRTRRLRKIVKKNIRI